MRRLCALVTALVSTSRCDDENLCHASQFVQLPFVDLGASDEVVAQRSSRLQPQCMASLFLLIVNQKTTALWDARGRRNELARGAFSLFLIGSSQWLASVQGGIRPRSAV